jgi:hypothetical protein
MFVLDVLLDVLLDATLSAKTMALDVFTAADEAATFVPFATGDELRKGSESAIEARLVRA